MATETQKGIDFEETLKLFNQRAAESEERLARLESTLKSTKGTENRDAEKEKLLEKIGELEEKLEDADAKEKKHVAEIEKLKYREIHLIRAVREADQKLETIKGHDLKTTTESMSQKLKL